VLLSDDELLTQKVLRRMQSLEKNLEDFNNRFEEEDLGSLIESDEVLGFREEALKIHNKLKRLMKYEQNTEIDLDALILADPDFMESLQRFQITIESLGEDVSEHLSDDEDSETEDNFSVGTPILKFHLFFWSASLIASAIPSYVSYLYFQEQWWAFFGPILLGLFIAYKYFEHSFILCPNCSMYIRRNQALLGTESLGYQDGWHTETEQVRTDTSYSNNSYQQVGASSSTSYVNRSVPHRDYFYRNQFDCYSCGRKFVENTSDRVNL
jgi:hypothetical protein